MFEGVVNTIRSWAVNKGDASSRNQQPVELNGTPVHQVKGKSYLARAAQESARKVWNLSVSILTRAINITSTPIIWLTENRLGVAKLIGRILVPSQFSSVCDSSESKHLVSQLCDQSTEDGPRFEVIPVNDGNTELKAMICYPSGWDKQENKNSRCIVFNNPNGMLTHNFFKNGKLQKLMLPGYLQQDRKCPIIFYDYSGTGLNQTETSSWPTSKTITNDGCAVLKTALEKFQHVEVTGTSLGGGVATTSLEKVMSEDSSIEPERVNLISHDSFTTSPRVVLPRLPKLADTLGWLVGGSLNAEKSMQKLIDRKVSITVLSNLDDKMIRKGARMADFARKFKDRPEVTVVEDPIKFMYAHGLFTDIFRETLKTSKEVEPLAPLMTHPIEPDEDDDNQLESSEEYATAPESVAETDETQHRPN